MKNIGHLVQRTETHKRETICDNMDFHILHAGSKATVQ
jgi:hypothetical protein